MKKRSLLMLTSLALIVVIAVIIIIQWRTGVDTPSISIPSPSVSGQGGGGGYGNSPLGADIDTAQALIASIERPDSYSRKYRVTTYWAGGEAEAELTVYCKDEQYRIIHSQNGVVKNILFSGGKRHIWYDGSNTVSTVNIKDMDINTLDFSARLLFYDELPDIPKEDILDASDETYLNESCIYVEYRHSETQVYRLHVSVIRGLLVGAEVLEDGRTVYLLESETPDITVPPDDVFTPPR